MNCALSVNAGACLSPKDELAQEHLRIRRSEIFITPPDHGTDIRKHLLLYLKKKRATKMVAPNEGGKDSNI